MTGHRITRQFNRHGLAGCVKKGTSQYGSIVHLFVAEQADFDPAGGPWVTTCSTHATVCNHASRAAAEAHLLLADWCEACMYGDKGAQAPDQTQAD